MYTQEDFEAKLANLTVTKMEEPTMHSYDKLLEELRPIATKIKTNLFPNGEN
jgi:hypothetical protein